MTRRSPRTWQDRLSIVLVIGLLVAAGLAGVLVTQTNVLSRYYDDTSDDVTSLCDDKQNADKTECAEPPPDAPELLPGPPGPGVSADEVRAAVNELLPVFIGPAVSDYCGTNGCRGPDGADGADGADGSDGEAGVTGEQGPAGPPGQDGATGPQGPPGEPGQPGETGAQGPPGETCPEGTSLQETTVMTSPTESTVIYACR